jgi:hypothetical protein
MRVRWVYVAIVLQAIAWTLAAGLRAQSGGASAWWDPGRDGPMPAGSTYDDSLGQIAVLNSSGPVDTKGHPFFVPLGANGRACVTCHQPMNAMSISADTVRERWRQTRGKDPLFAAVDGSNCPSLPQDLESSHSLLLNRGLIRVSLPWPPVRKDGSRVTPEFSVEVVSDPTGCNTDPMYGLKSGTPRVSVFRRPRVAANLKYVAAESGPFNIKTGDLADVDPETGIPVAMNIMSDARESTLKTQAVSAASDHLEVRAPLTADQINRIVAFETQVYVAQQRSNSGGNLVEEGGPDGLGAEALARGQRGLGDNIHTPVFGFFEPWRKADSGSGLSDAERRFRASVARGSDVFFLRPIWIRDTTHINTVGLGNPIKRTCATCHNARLVGMDLAPGYVDLGTTNYPRWTEPALWTEKQELPVFKITCNKDAPPHPYLGRVIYTTDPGRALISGKCFDVGAIVMQQMRGLAARAPYFANGSMRTLRELVDYYDRRFDAKYREEEKQDLVNFLSVL